MFYQVLMWNRKTDWQVDGRTDRELALTNRWSRSEETKMALDHCPIRGIWGFRVLSVGPVAIVVLLLEVTTAYPLILHLGPLALVPMIFNIWAKITWRPFWGYKVSVCQVWTLWLCHLHILQRYMYSVILTTSFDDMNQKIRLSVKNALISDWNDFSPILLGKCAFKRRVTKICKKIQILTILRAPSIQHQGVCLFYKV